MYMYLEVRKIYDQGNEAATFGLISDKFANGSKTYMPELKS